MANPSITRSILVAGSVITFVSASTYIISIFARGYQLDLTGKPTLNSTGIVSLSSKPKGASVYIDDRLITATDDTINLPPNQDYQIKIVKDGYLPWQKKYDIKKEIVYQTDTQLYRSVPDLKPITLSGAINPNSSPLGDKIVFAVASASAQKDNGLYLIDTSDINPINRGTPKQIASNFSQTNWLDFTFEFSPNARQILAQSTSKKVNYLLSLDSGITQDKLLDVTAKLSIIKEDWDNQNQIILNNRLAKIPKNIQPLISTQSAKHLIYSSSDEKILYLANKDGNLDNNYISPPPAQSTQTQTRNIIANNYYVYDLLEDTNFYIGSQKDITNPSWIPFSNTIFYTQEDKIKIIEYDATNINTIFAGTFDKNHVFSWPDGNKLLVLTSAYSGAQNNLYSITIR